MAKQNKAIIQGDKLKTTMKQVKRAKEAQEMDDLFREIEKELSNALRICEHLKRRVENMRRERHREEAAQ